MLIRNQTRKKSNVIFSNELYRDDHINRSVQSACLTPQLRKGSMQKPHEKPELVQWYSMVILHPIAPPSHMSPGWCLAAPALCLDTEKAAENDPSLWASAPTRETWNKFLSPSFRSAKLFWLL